MALKKMVGPVFAWHHYTRPRGKVVLSLLDIFSLTADDEELMHTARLPRAHERDACVMFFVFVPSAAGKHLAAQRVTFLVRKDVVATVTDAELPSLERLLGGKPLHQRFSHGSSSNIVAWLLTELFETLHIRADRLVDDIQKLEAGMPRMAADEVTRRLGSLRRELLELDLMVEPHVALVQQLLDIQVLTHTARAREILLSLRDGLQGTHTVLDHYVQVLDGLFRIHDAALTQKTNQVVQVLTVMSVLMMPPTLVASYYGMNVAGLPFAHDIRVVSAFILCAVIVFLFLVHRIFKR